MSDTNITEAKKEVLVELDGQPTSPENLEEAKKTLPKNKRVQEVTPGVFHTLTRMQE